ncbi:division/cell wall cluster transcriptional repressor MraZ [Ferrimonas lipolytica]|uniref:Transcriptional regulator MraZ n=1 Tax=Ferrimonas lipolytica TaxID=2724191 RepID=A0A6H1UHK0_9GAMM|nr:division/cell wall cluster transcriptional repressor MraZ [Ferrimonas lipolytica]QIZ78524.1 division/cell wall cluster transcriptional repressor MraZ [Ferrimonas lipolytica]
MFRGANAISLDSKGRITMPTRYRDGLRTRCDCQMICTVDLRSPCLLLYPLPEWEQVEKKLLTLSDTVPAERQVKRLLLGYATEGEMDKAGRLLLSGPLREFAQLEKSLMLVGQLNKFEVWSEANWQQQIELAREQTSQNNFDNHLRLQELTL